VRFWSVVLVVLAGVVTVTAQDTLVVTARSKTEPQAAVDLAEVGLAGKLTATRVTIAPGTMNTEHTHAGRTSILVIVQGSLTEVRGSSKRQYSAGDVVTVAEGVTHHAENHASVPVVYVEINATTKK
jgi:quercetin dioxygenase-like cupin family protein